MGGYGNFYNNQGRLFNMQIKTFSGNFVEIGKQQGKVYHKRRMSFKNLKIDPKLFGNQLRVYKKFYPELLKEFEGIAEAGNFDKNKLIYHFITAEIKCYKDWFGSKKACTIFGFKNKDKLFVGRNYDWAPKTQGLFEIYKVQNPQRNSFIALTDGGYGSEAGTNIKNLFYNADDAINDKGLFIGLTFAYSDNWSYGLSCVHMTKLIAETCATVQEAIKVFEKVPLCCPKNFFIADKNGHMVIIEHTSQKFKVIYPKNGILIQTNHYVDPELAKEDTVLKRVPIHNTHLRYHETFQRINFSRNKFNLNKVINVLGKKGTYTCQNFPGVKTIWTLALDMTNKKYKVYWNIFEKRKEKVLRI